MMTWEVVRATACCPTVTRPAGPLPPLRAQASFVVAPESLHELLGTLQAGARYLLDELTQHKQPLSLSLSIYLSIYVSKSKSKGNGMSAQYVCFTKQNILVAPSVQLFQTKYKQKMHLNTKT
jgi:hypothetical protein